MSQQGRRQSGPREVVQDPADRRGHVIGTLADLALNHPRLLVRRAGCDAGDLTALETEALALLAFAFLWGRLARPTHGVAGVGPPVQLVALLIGNPRAEANRGLEPFSLRQWPDEWNRGIELERALFAKLGLKMLGDLRRRGNPESDPGELLIAAARSFVFLHRVAFGESRGNVARRSIMEYQDAGIAAEASHGDGDGPGAGPWAAHWKRVIPMLHEEIASSRIDLSRPGHVVADLVALRVFYRASIGDVLPFKQSGWAPDHLGQASA